MTYDEMEAFLLSDGNLRVPCSRYGWDTRSCAPTAIAVAEIVAGETGMAGVDEDLLDYVMGLVVNDHDDPATILTCHGLEYGYDYADYLEE